MGRLLAVAPSPALHDVEVAKGLLTPERDPSPFLLDSYNPGLAKERSLVWRDHAGIYGNSGTRILQGDYTRAISLHLTRGNISLSAYAITADQNHYWLRSADVCLIKL